MGTAGWRHRKNTEHCGEVDKEFLHELSARSRANRPGLDSCIDYLRDHDELYVASVGRLARPLVDLRGMIDQITAKGASVHFLKENLAFSKEAPDRRASFMLGILGSFAELERAISSEDLEKARQRVASNEYKVTIAKDLGVGRATLYRSLAGWESIAVVVHSWGIRCGERLSVQASEKVVRVVECSEEPHQRLPVQSGVADQIIHGTLEVKKMIG